MYVMLLSMKRKNSLKVKASYLYHQTLQNTFPLTLKEKRMTTEQYYNAQ